MAVNIDTATPINNVMAKPLTMLVENVINIKQVMIVKKFESLIDDQARLKPSSRAAPNGLPLFISSLSRENISTFASTAMPIEIINPAMPDKVNVTLNNLNKDNTIIEYIRSEKTDIKPGKR